MSRTLAEVVGAALEELSPKQQKAFALMVLHGVPMSRVAAQGGGSAEALQGEVVAALKHMKQRLAEAGMDVPGLVQGLAAKR